MCLYTFLEDGGLTGRAPRGASRDGTVFNKPHHSALAHVCFCPHAYHVPLVPDALVYPKEITRPSALLQGSSATFQYDHWDPLGCKGP